MKRIIQIGHWPISICRWRPSWPVVPSANLAKWSNPGINFYSPQDDIQLGRQAAAEIRKQVDVVDNQALQNYVSEVGQKLASQPEAGDYPYSFTLINDESINAFALPGGPVFIHSGLLKAADSEAEFAGVLAHEISHVVLRHGTNQASKANLVQLPAVLAGTAIGNNGALAQLGQLGLGFGVNALLLKYSRTAEKQADATGARIMAGAGYNPLAMADFFEKLEAEGGSRPPAFLSSHPNPGNRVTFVQAEIQALPASGPYNAGTGEFQQMKKFVAQLPPSKPRQEIPQAGAAPNPSVAGYTTLETGAYTVAHPEGWRGYGADGSSAVTIAPEGGLVRTSSGSVAIGYGAVLSMYQPQSRNATLASATKELMQLLSRSNANFRQSGAQRSLTVDGNRALMTPVTSQSPFGGSETDILFTVARPNGLFYIVFIAPSDDFQRVQPAYETMMKSVRFRG